MEGSNTSKTMSAIQRDTQPIVVQVVGDEPVESTTAADVLIGAIGLTGVLILVALLLGAVLGAVLIGFKKLRARLDMEPVPDSEALKISPFP
jgi:hypothetical protein